MPTGSLYLSTVECIPGFRTDRYLGLVNSEACIAPEAMQDIKAFIERVEGGRHPDFERVNRLARHEALAGLESEAKELGANAVIGIKFQFAYMTDLGLLLISVSGTAVTVSADA